LSPRLSNNPHHVVAFDAHAFAAENFRRASNSMTPSAWR
jgi:hypothetical protein